MSRSGARRRRQSPSRLAALSIGALGIVYGDIGTSPLYALRESFTGAGHEIPVTTANVLGVLSLIFWSLVVVISLKYLTFVMRADNDGEGGLLALTALVTRSEDRPNRRRWLIVAIGLFGTGLLYGDGMITPAISVLSAVEGTAVATPTFEPYVIPIAIAILVGLFAVQRWGAGAVGTVFGPAMIVWFGVLGVLGASQLVHRPEVLDAIGPAHLVEFFAQNPRNAILVLGSVFLVVTGGEALYADLGHFGRLPITLGWYAVVLPGLGLNYFGQGALLLQDASAIDNPFYRLAPSWGLVPLVVLATVATVIASQALISGVFSLSLQAARLGYLPRMRILHTSAKERGQIYVPAVNWALMLACIGLVVGFRSSTNLAAAYGVAVTVTMAITTLVFYVVVRERFRWSRGVALSVGAVFFAVDVAFVSGNISKIPHGGWFPLVAGAVIFAVLTTWRTGRRLVAARLRSREVPLERFVAEVADAPVARVPGTAVFLYSVPGVVPPALRTSVLLQRTLHERVVVVSVSTADAPKVQPAYRVARTDLGHGFEQVELTFGFTDDTDVPTVLRRRQVVGDEEVTYFLGAENVAVTERPGMARWREHLYAFMHRNASPVSNYFKLPRERTVSIGTQVEL